MKRPSTPPNGASIASFEPADIASITAPVASLTRGPYNRSKDNRITPESGAILSFVANATKARRFLKSIVSLHCTRHKLATTKMEQSPKAVRLNAGADLNDAGNHLIRTASSCRMNPGGLPCLERTSNQSPVDPITLTLVPVGILPTFREELVGSSKTDVLRTVS